MSKGSLTADLCRILQMRIRALTADLRRLTQIGDSKALRARCGLQTTDYRTYEERKDSSRKDAKGAKLGTAKRRAHGADYRPLTTGLQRKKR